MRPPRHYTDPAPCHPFLAAAGGAAAVLALVDRDTPPAPAVPAAAPVPVFLLSKRDWKNVCSASVCVSPGLPAWAPHRHAHPSLVRRSPGRPGHGGTQVGHEHRPRLCRRLVRPLHWLGLLALTASLGSAGPADFWPCRARKTMRTRPSETTQYDKQRDAVRVRRGDTRATRMRSRTPESTPCRLSRNACSSIGATRTPPRPLWRPDGRHTHTRVSWSSCHVGRAPVSVRAGKHLVRRGREDDVLERCAVRVAAAEPSPVRADGALRQQGHFGGAVPPGGHEERIAREAVASGPVRAAKQAVEHIAEGRVDHLVLHRRPARQRGAVWRAEPPRAMRAAMCER